MSLNFWFKKFFPMCPDAFERTFFVDAHQTAVADNVR